MNQINPIFIGGCPRSGTTMLASLLANDRKTLATPESQFKMDIINKFELRNEEILSEIIKNLQKNFRFRIWDIGISYETYVKKYGKDQIYAKVFIEYLLDEYNNKYWRKKFTLWVDHTPENIKYAMKLLSIFPNAKFIHIIRDGRAVANSLKKVTWGGYSTYYTSIHWASNISYGLALEKKLSSEQFFTVKYEDIVLNTESTLQKICNFVGIEFDFDMINGKGFLVPEYTQSQHSLVGGGLNVQRVTSWKNALSSFEIQVFEKRTGELLEYLGYDLLYDTFDFRISRKRRYEIYCTEVFEYLKSRYKQKKRIRKYFY